jgi:hypothetical protein
VTTDLGQFTGRIYAARVGPHGQPNLYLHDPEAQGVYFVRALTEDEVTELAQQLADMQEQGPTPPAKPRPIGAARTRQAGLKRLRAERSGGGAG